VELQVLAELQVQVVRQELQDKMDFQRD